MIEERNHDYLKFLEVSLNQNSFKCNKKTFTTQYITYYHVKLIESDE